MSPEREMEEKDEKTPPAGEVPDEAPVLPPSEVRAVLEALIFASPQPVTARDITKVMQGVPKADWERALEEIRADYAATAAGCSSSRWRTATRSPPARIQRLGPRADRSQAPTRLSIQALETLA